MPRPKRYWIDGKPSSVRYQRKVGVFLGGYPVSGEHTGQKIKVRGKLTRQDERQTVLHEVMHDCLDRADARAFVPLRTEEALVTLLEPFLFLALRDNPELREYLFEEES